MKQIILFTISIFISVAGVSQNISSPTKWNNSFLEAKQITPKLKIYPNPCKTNIVTIDFNSNQISEIQLTNITGKQVFSKKFDFAENKIQLELNDIQNGIYLLRVKSIDNKIVVKKFIVSRD